MKHPRTAAVAVAKVASVVLALSVLSWLVFQAHRAANAAPGAQPLEIAPPGRGPEEQPPVGRNDDVGGRGFLPSSKSGVVTTPTDKALSLPYLSTSKSLVIDGAASFYNDGSEPAAPPKPAEGKAPRFLFSSKSAAPIVEPPADR